MSGADVMPVKSRRVRTGCLTCRERHLKCDEETPDCRNCRKSNRECKRGVRLNFIDLTCREPPFIPQVDDWLVEFQDESRLIASEYRGGLGRYPKFDDQVTTPPQDAYLETSLQKNSQNSKRPELRRNTEHASFASTRQHQGTYYDERGQTHPELLLDAQIHSRKGSAASYGQSMSASSTPRYGNPPSDVYAPVEDMDTGFHSHQRYRGSDISTAASVAGVADAGPPSATRSSGSGKPDIAGNLENGVATPDDNSGERYYLTSPEELRFMQVFVSEVGLWMDSLDKEKHFSRLIPYHALKCPMLLNALLACGVKHLTLTQLYSDEKALFYYDTATTQLLRSLQNPERNTEECAATAVVLNVYEIMSEKPTQRMSHIAGARALIRECGWNAKSTGLGAACFWLNVGMELLSCLAFNWQTAWDPETWGVNMNFETDREAGREEIWVHRIFYIVAKIANFRASIPKFQEPSPHDEQLRVQARMAEWNYLKDRCEKWNDACPRPMHPFGYIRPSEQTGPKKSLFPNVWLIKRAAVVGRLYYHMALCILAQVNPSTLKDSQDSRTTQQHHAHQVCGIVAHNEDRGVASVSIRSLVIVSEVLTDYAEQEEVAAILERIDRETGWKLAGIIAGLKKRWGWEKMEQPTPLAAQLLGSAPPSGNNNTLGGGSGKQPVDRLAAGRPLATTAAPQQQMMLTPVTQVPATTAPQQMQPVVAASRSMRVNPLSFADFSLPNHPYQNWYEPPSRSKAYHSHGLP
ncbi:putative C6 zinc finger domain-containing protein [Rosellinia necatrix]|uniref:Putative C6 zinc finger domain-containing protein n=1 Tax=Rosellinia necatrix TaxID=77044 RepID=A0A1W2TTI5_ROSNE|nr:putative C6 zinc finger domain-containing protein [Rosellinia necatrix]